MEQFSARAMIAARVLIAVVFVLNAFAIIDQTIPTRELMARGVPAGVASMFMLGGRALELIAGFALALGLYPRLAALTLFAFLIPATVVSHSFWLAAGTPAFQPQLINFSKNVAILGGLLFVAASSAQPALLRPKSMSPNRSALRSSTVA